MEKQKLAYEEAAIAALQRATQDKAEADSRAATLEVVAWISRKSSFCFCPYTITFDQPARLCPPGDPDRHRGGCREVAKPLRGATAEICAAQEEPESQRGSTAAAAEPSGGASLSQLHPQADRVRPPGSHLQQHLCSLQLSRTRETRLREEVESLKQQRQELQYDVHLLEEDNQVLREEIQQLRGEPARFRLLTDARFFWFPCPTSSAAFAR